MSSQLTVLDVGHGNCSILLDNGLAGVIDADYRGDVGVILLNTGDSDFVIRDGDRIAQIIIEKIDMDVLTIVDSIKDLGLTDRGEGGFGSTGV